jgi:hypothetical protein
MLFAKTMLETLRPAPVSYLDTNLGCFECSRDIVGFALPEAAHSSVIVVRKRGSLAHNQIGRVLHGTPADSFNSVYDWPPIAGLLISS